ncbi:hypothetical protein L9F63_002196 [Diploptera punctata]|uniref:Uncharacterized protein n=1 Tax=Diploptera punctata TaxID=6984 RepID=A0AAD8A4F6_DIPPU|nr:hypothetical protein L9F63_002196 [Diploptera punctata]
MLGLLFLLLPSVSTLSQELTTCIFRIAHQYFTPGRPLLVSLSSTAKNINNMLQILHSESNWPFLIKSFGSETVYNDYDDIAKHFSYIIFVQTLQEDDDVIEIMGEQIEEIELSDCWNPRAKFLIVIAGPLSQEREELAQDVAEELWRTYKIVEVVILIPELGEESEAYGDEEQNEVDVDGEQNEVDDNDDNEDQGNYEDDDEQKFTYANDDKNIIAFELYAWIPYQSSEICAEVNIFLIDKWIAAEGNFETLTNLYPSKIPHFFNGCPIVVSPMEAPPIYVMAVNYTDENGVVHYDYTGYEPALMKAILTLMNFTIVYNHIPMEDAYNTRVQSLFDLRSGRMDVVMGCIPLHPIVGSMNDYTDVIYGDDVLWLVPCGKPNPRMQQVGKIFSVSLWCAVISVIIVSAIIMWQITKHSVGESPGYKSIPICLVNLWAVTLGVGVTEQPRTARQRTVFLFLVWYSFAINLLFQTYFTSILVDPGISAQIETRDELYSSDLIYEYKGGLDTYISNAYPEYYNEITLPRRECNYKDTCVVEYYKRDDMTTISTVLFTECFLLLALPSDSDAPHFCIVEETITTILFPMYLTKGSPLVKAY